MGFERRRQEMGAALVAVLWGTVVIALLAASTAGLARQATGSAYGALAEARARHAAEGALHLAAAGLIGSTDYVTANALRQFTIGHVDVTIRMVEESGKIDLNAAPVELLIGALRAAGADADQSRNIGNAVADWRDSDSLRRLAGAEAADYRATGLPYVPRNGLFRSVGELRLVLGMDDALFAAVRPLITVHNRHAGIDPTAAPRDVLLALPGANEEAVDDWIERRAAQNGRGAPPAFTTRWRRGTTAVRHFTIRADARISDGSAAAEALLELRRESRMPRVIEWQIPEETPT